MGTTIIGNKREKQPEKKKERAKDASLTPLANKFLDANPELHGKEYPIYSGGLTQKGFLLLKCKEFSVLMPGATEIATTILDDILPALANKQANQMVAVLNRGNRFGADIGTNDESKVWYIYNQKEETFYTTKEKPTKEEKEEKKLSLEDFGITT